MDDDLDPPRFVRHNVVDGIVFTRSARKHRVPHGDVRHVLAHPRVSVALEPIAPHLDRRTLVLGASRAGAPLEVIAIIRSDRSTLVVHAMPLRAKFRALYERS